MIIYNPLDGDAFTSSISSNSRHCFLMTRLGKPIPPMVKDIGDAITERCGRNNYKVIDASTRVTGRDFLLKILAIDYLKRAYLITGEERLKVKAKNLLDLAGLEKRAANSVELLAAAF